MLNVCVLTYLFTDYSYPPIAGVDVSEDITEKERVKARKALQEYYGVGMW
jgi:hypothetical protein